MLKYLGIMAQELAEEAVEADLTPAEISAEVMKRSLSLWLDRHKGNQLKTALRLGIHRNTLLYTMRRLGVRR
jgi:DNA-binding PucR family transcriptional regulator